MVPLNISQEPENLTIEICDLVFQNTVLKRKATLDSLFLSIRAQEVSANWWVEIYADNNGEYGEKINHPVIKDYMKTFATRKDDFVDATGASILQYAVDTDEDGNQVTTDRIVQPAGTVNAYRFFNWLAANHSVVIYNLLRANGLKQNAAGKF